MANDNLLAGLTGLLEGVSSVAVPMLLNRQKANLELELLKQKLPIEEASKRRESDYDLQNQMKLESYKDPLELNRKIQEERFKTDEDIRKAKATAGLKQEGKNDPVTGLPKDLQDRLNELDAVIGDVNALEEQYHKTPKGIAGAGQSFGAHIPLVGPTMFPGVKRYEDSVPSVALNVQRVLTKSVRAGGGASGLRAESVAFPDPKEAPEVGKSKFMEVRRKLITRRSEIMKRAKSQGTQVQLDTDGSLGSQDQDPLKLGF